MNGSKVSMVPRTIVTQPLVAASPQTTAVPGDGRQSQTMFGRVVNRDSGAAGPPAGSYVRFEPPAVHDGLAVLEARLPGNYRGGVALVVTGKLEQKRWGGRTNAGGFYFEIADAKVDRNYIV